MAVLLSRRDFLLLAPAMGGFLQPGAAKAHQAARKWAFVVGVGDYQISAKLPPAHSVNLLGPKNDALAIAQMLQERYRFLPGNIRVLQDRQATRSAILAGWDWLKQQARPGDLVVFYFSGHGTRVPERIPGSKPQGFDSALCPYDAERGNGLIVGWEIGAKIDALPTDEVVVIVDACHSGSASRSLLGKTKFIDPRVLGISGVKEAVGGLDIRSMPITARSSDVKQKERYLGAASTLEKALDLPLLPQPGPAGGNNRNMGLMTYCLLEEARQDVQGTLTYAELAERLEAKIAERAGTMAHRPQLSGPHLTTQFLTASGKPQGAAAGIVARVGTVSGQQVTLLPLPGTTLTVGSILVGTSSKDWAEVDTSSSERGQIEVSSVENTRSLGRLLKGAVVPGETLREVFQGVNLSGKLRVAFREENETARQLRKQIQLDFVTFIPLDQAIQSPGDLILEASGENRIQPHWGGIPLPPVTAVQLPDTLKRCYRQMTLLGLRGKGTGPRITFTSDNRTGFIEARIGQKIGFEMSVDRASYVTLVALNSDGTVTGLGLADEKLDVDSRWRISGVTVKGPAGLDIIMVIAAPFPLTVSLPKSPEEARERGTAAVIRDILNSFRQSVNPQGLAAEGSRGNDFTGAVSTVSGKPDSPLSVHGWSTAFLFQRTQ